MRLTVKLESFQYKKARIYKEKPQHKAPIFGIQFLTGTHYDQCYYRFSDGWWISKGGYAFVQARQGMLENIIHLGPDMNQRLTPMSVRR